MIVSTDNAACSVPTPDGLRLGNCWDRSRWEDCRLDNTKRLGKSTACGNKINAEIHGGINQAQGVYQQTAAYLCCYDK